MKKLFVITLLIAFLMPSITTKAQKLNFGVKAGFGMASMSARDDDDTFTDDRKPKLALHMGGVIQYNLMDALALEGGLLFSFKGVKYKGSDLGYDYKEAYNLFYMVIPITAKYTFDLGSISIYGQAGPYIGIGLAGKYKWEDEYYDDEAHTETIEWGTSASNDDLKRPDFGITIGAGVVVFGNLQAGIYLEKGLANISPYTHNNYRVKNSVFGLTAVYLFRK